MFNADETIQRLRDAVALRGRDFQYEKAFPESSVCSYVVKNEPACIAGFAFFDILPDPRTNNTKTFEGYFWNDATVATVDFFTDNLDADSIKILRVAQSVQDDGDSWGEALEAAEEAFTEIKTNRG